MHEGSKELVAGLLAAAAFVAVMLPGMHVAYADDTTGLAFDSVTIEEAESHTQVADLMAGEVSALKAGVTYALDVSYKVPSGLHPPRVPLR